jgi:hypothetical protein
MTFMQKHLRNHSPRAITFQEVDVIKVVESTTKARKFVAEL